MVAIFYLVRGMDPTKNTIGHRQSIHTYTVLQKVHDRLSVACLSAREVMLCRKEGAMRAWSKHRHVRVHAATDFFHIVMVYLETPISGKVKSIGEVDGVRRA